MHVAARILHVLSRPPSPYQLDHGVNASLNWLSGNHTRLAECAVVLQVVLYVIWPAVLVFVAVSSWNGS